MHGLFLLFLMAGASPAAAAEDPAPLPPARVELRVEAPDLAGPWKLVVENQGSEPVRFAADGRLLTFEVEAPEGIESPYEASATKGKKQKGPPPPVVCTLPSDLRPSGVVDDRAVILGPGARYEEIVSPAFYCFGQAAARALTAGARVKAKLGFPAPAVKPGTKKAPPLRPPFVAEPSGKSPTTAALKELVAATFVVPAASPVSGPTRDEPDLAGDERAPSIELIAPERIDSANERTVAMTLTVKNGGGRAVPLHARRDNLLFEVDGPNGSAPCGQPAERRRVPQDLVGSLAAGGARTIDVWIGEMCPDMVFDRPGLYRVRAGIAFPASNEPSTARPWGATVFAKRATLVRIRDGHLPFYSSPPEILGASDQGPLR